jgi:hypothetical protein
MSSSRNARRALCALVLAVAVAAPVTSWAAPRASASRRLAERRVLASPRVFLRWHGRAASLVDPHTKLFRTNVTAVCRASRAARGIVCAVRYGASTVRVRYAARGPRSFRLTQLR